MTVALGNHFNGMTEITKTRLLLCFNKKKSQKFHQENSLRDYDWSVFIVSDLRLTLAMMTSVKTLLIGIIK